MNIKDILKKGLPYFFPVIAFVIISFIYFSPILDGKELPQMDHTHTQGMAKELIDYSKSNPDDVALWTNSMFGGMPSYQIKGDNASSIFTQINSLIQSTMPYGTVAILFFYLIGFYILLISLKIDKWLSFAGSIAFAFASYNLIIIIAGHITKAYAIGMMAPVVAGAILTYRKKYLGGGLLFLVALGSEIAMNHVQITYYLALMIGLFVIIELIEAFKSKEFTHFAKATAILGVGAILAVAPNSTNLLTTYEYGKVSIRGESELENPNVKKASGLDKDYALAWSYGIKETWNVMIPNAVGGESSYMMSNKNALDNVKPEYRQQIGQQNQYWGEMPFTSGPVYIGAIVCFLFVLGLFLIEGAVKWWLLASTVLSFLLAWGKNFGWFTDLFFYNFPLYNKFRTVSMILVVANLAMPLLAILSLDKILKKPEIIKIKMKEFFIALGLTGGLALIFWLLPTVFFDFFSTQEKQMISKQLSSPEVQKYIAQFNDFVSEWESARVIIFKADAIRTFIFIALSGGLLWFYSKKKFKKEYIIVAFALLFFADMWPIAKRYLNNDDFVIKTTQNNDFTPSFADKFILTYKNTDPNADKNYRVFNISRNPFTEVNTSYFHKSIGGYHGAKLRRYQDVIDSVLVKSMQRLASAVRQNDSMKTIYRILPNEHVLNMLNTMYVIYDPNKQPIVNFNSLGDAWFVNNYKLVNNANEELQAIKNFNPKETLIVDKRFESQLKGFTPKRDSVRSLIKMINYKPNELTYQINARKDELVAFADIYYEKGWSAYLDDKKTDHFRANYILRAMQIPKGTHLLQFKFEPKSYSTGKIISTTSSVLIVLLILGYFAKLIFDEKKKSTTSKDPS